MPNPVDLTDPIYNDDEAARAYIEAQRWPDGPFCPHCGERERVTKLKGKSTRPGLHACAACRQHFTVTVGTIYERSHLPLHKWVLATHLMAASKKGISAHQLHRMLDLPYKTAWFMAHRIRAGMGGAADDPGGLGGPGKIVEADETYFGNKDEITTRTKHGKPGLASKRAVVALVERKGKARTFHVERADADTVKKLLRENASRKSKLMTDESRLYTEVGAEFARHGEPQRRRVCRVRRSREAHEHGGKLLFRLQARHEGQLSALRRAAPTPVRCRIRVPLQRARGARV